MKTTFIFFLLILISLNSYTQEEDNFEEEQIVFGAHPEIKPSYKGGVIQLRKDINMNLEYPSQAAVSAKVYVGFLIDTLGQVTEVKIARGFSEEFDKEAIRVVKLLKNWTPGTRLGKKVAYNYTIPISFDLTN